MTPRPVLRLRKKKKENKFTYEKNCYMINVLVRCWKKTLQASEKQKKGQLVHKLQRDPRPKITKVNIKKYKISNPREIKEKSNWFT